jgi:pimeloyl-ACP methyl ester carboxylesterase
VVRSLITISTALSIALSGVAYAQQPVLLAPPLDAAIAKGFDPPDSDFGPGHRGIDYETGPGQRVRAAAPGTVTFAGEVGGALFVTVMHDSQVETTYSRLGAVSVRVGQEVGEGTWLGVTDAAHPGDEGLHFGVKVDGSYVDPLSMMGPSYVAGAIHLAPLVWEPSAEIPEPLRSALMPRSAGTSTRPCVERVPRAYAPVPPNGNIAVAVAGIGSKTQDGVAADMYEQGPELLGYAPRSVYEFSYAGTDGPRLHDPYPSRTTFDDLNASAHKLNDLLRAIGRRHPGRDVDLIAHSQGGIVARTWLALQAESFDPDLPRVAHLVTFSSPHSGAPLAGEVDELATSSFSGAGVLLGASKLAAAGAPVPDPLSAAVQQLAPESHLMKTLAREDVAYGTRVLTLGIPNDVVVPTGRTDISGEGHRVVSPKGLNGHSAIVASPVARGLAYDFLRGAAPACPGTWDRWGPKAGRVVSWFESRLGRGYGLAESIGLGIPRP